MLDVLFSQISVALFLLKIRHYEQTDATSALYAGRIESCEPGYEQISLFASLTN